VLHGAPSPDTHVWRDALVRCCLRLRRASLRQPAMAGLVRSGPSLHANESAITEYVLSCFASAGLDGRALADAYHAVIELTVGSAAIDASVAALPSHDRSAAYARWRRHYRNADPAVRPASRHAAKELYAGTAERRFLVAVNALIDGLVAGSGSRDGQ
jgi:TetR/AcrR family transcriptional regulator, tetracycline repressor protein